MGRLIFCFILLVILNSGHLYSQNIDTLDYSFKYKNSLQVELLGTNSLYSINLERVILNESKFKTTGQVGLTYLPFDWGAEFLINGMINELISFKKHHIEIGLGYGLAYMSTNKVYQSGNFDFFTGKLGYRFQKPEGNFVFKIAFTPNLLLQGGQSIDYGLWGGILFGYNFGKK